MRRRLKKYRLFRALRSRLPAAWSLHYRTYLTTRELLKSTSHFTLQEHTDWQYERLKELVGYCWDNIRGYRNLWERSGFQPSMLKTPEDIKKIPAINKELLRKELDHFTNRNLKGIEYITTGGSTGIPFGFYIQAENHMIEKACIHHLWSQYVPDIDLKTPSTILRGRIVPGGMTYDPMHGLILSSYHLTAKQAALFATAMEKYQTPILHAYPSSLYVLAKIMKRNNLKIRHRFRAVMLGSEVLYPYHRDIIAEVFRAPICHWYGLAEKTILAGTCPEDDRFHIVPEYGIAEIITERGTEASKDEKGELVGTSLWVRATPFIRYRTMDYAFKGEHTHTGCTFHYPLFDRVEGRVQELVVGRSNKLITLAALSIVCGKFTGVEQFKFHQSEPGRLVFNYVRSGKDEPVNETTMNARLMHVLGNDFEITFKEVDSIPVTATGKLCYLQQDLDIEKFL